MIVPCLRAATIASFATSGVVSLSAQKMPPVWNHREPSLPKISSQSICPGFNWLTAVCPRSEQPNAARTPNPRSVKFKPLRVVRPTPSYFVHITCDWSTPPWSIRSSSSRPTGLSASAVTMAVFNPKHRRNPRATLYSPPPSHTLKWRAVATRTSPGSSRSMTSPRLTRSHLHSSFARTTRLFASFAAFVTPTFPSGLFLKLKSLFCLSLLQIRNSNRVHIVICLILSTHSPAERVVLRTDAGVNRPTRRHHHFLIRDHKMARGIWRSHEVHHAVGGVHIEVEIDFAASHVRVGRHRIPVAARGEHRKSHHQLAALNSILVDRLVDRSLVTGLKATQFEPFQIGELHHRRWILLVRRIAQQVKVGRIACVLARESNR